MPPYDRGMAAWAALVLAIHLAWILWVICGALVTRGRPWLTGFHIASLTWGIIAETGPWPCPLTMLEDWLETRAGMATYSGSFLVHYLDRIVYPNVPVGLIIGGAIAVCCVNLLIYLWRLAQVLRGRRTAD
jgi:hypothetical protein